MTVERTRLRLGVALVTLVVVTGAVAADRTGDATLARDRTTVDLPDDVTGPQVHFLYVVPSDGEDRQLDTNGQLEESIARIEGWFATQSGSQGLRVDTHDGVPDVTFVRLPHSNAQATATNPWPLWVIGEDLVAAGLDDPNKVYAAFYDGRSSWACGGANSPALPKLGAMYLLAHPTNDPRPCRDAPGFGTGDDRPGYFEIGLLHEILHVLGFTPRCAPHASADGYGDHVNDSPTDLMYGPDASSRSGWNWANAVLDFNRDDYYRANLPACPDLSNSPYVGSLHSVTVSVSGPGTVTSSPPGLDCPGRCTGTFMRSVTLMARPSAGARFTGWTGACTGTLTTCVVTSGGSAGASFVTAAHRRRLTLHVRGSRASGELRVPDGYDACRSRAVVLVERRLERRWSVVRRARTDRVGSFAVSLPPGRATYRARAPQATAGGQTCIEAVSRNVAHAG